MILVYCTNDYYTQALSHSANCSYVENKTLIVETFFYCYWGLRLRWGIYQMTLSRKICGRHLKVNNFYILLQSHTVLENGQLISGSTKEY